MERGAAKARFVLTFIGDDTIAQIVNRFASGKIDSNLPLPTQQLEEFKR
jgi:hypothetical protein